MIETLEVGLGAAFTPQEREAWQRTYAALSGAMIEVAYPAPAA